MHLDMKNLKKKRRKINYIKELKVLKEILQIKDVRTRLNPSAQRIKEFTSKESNTMNL